MRLPSAYKVILHFPLLWSLPGIPGFPLILYARSFITRTNNRASQILLYPFELVEGVSECAGVICLCAD